MTELSRLSVLKKRSETSNQTFSFFYVRWRIIVSFQLISSLLLKKTCIIFSSEAQQKQQKKSYMANNILKKYIN